MNRLRLFLAVLGLLVLAGTYAVLAPTEEPAAVAAPPVIAALAPTPVASTPAAPAGPAPIALSVDRPDRKRRITVTRGEPLVLEVTSSKPGALAIHGLAAGEFTLQAGVPSRIAVEATAPGRFGIHFHGERGEHADLGALDVRPRAAKGLQANRE